MKVLFGASLVTCTGYFVKHLMLVIYGIKARKLAKQKNDIFDDEVQKFLYLHRHSQSHLEQFRRVEAVTKLVPQVGATVFRRTGFLAIIGKINLDQVLAKSVFGNF